MRFKIVKIGRPIMSEVRQIQAISENEIAVSFDEPAGVKLALSWVLEIDLEVIGVDQVVVDLMTGRAMTLNISERDVHDLRLPMRHGVGRFPAETRRRGL